MNQNQNNEELMSPSELIRKKKSYLILSIVIFLISGFYVIFKLIQIFDNEVVETHDVWFLLSALLLVICILVCPASFIQIIRYLVELISLIRKQKGKERKKTEIRYDMPDRETQIYLVKKSDRSMYYIVPMIILSVIFMIFYIIVDAKYSNTLFSLMHYGESEDPEDILVDLFIFLAFISMIFLALFFWFHSEYLKQKKQYKKKKKTESKDTQISKSRLIRPFKFRKKNKTKNNQRFPVKSKDSMGPFNMKSQVGAINTEYGFCLVYAISYVLGMPLKIFLPLYNKYALNEVSPVINVLIFTFYGIFLIYLILILREVVPAWIIFKKYRVVVIKQ
jgi:hypothetical protein